MSSATPSAQPPTARTRPRPDPRYVFLIGYPPLTVARQTARDGRMHQQGAFTGLIGLTDGKLFVSSAWRHNATSIVAGARRLKFHRNDVLVLDPARAPTTRTYIGGARRRPGSMNPRTPTGRQLEDHKRALAR